jgi:two-component system, chemotaxis family, CheB/CheR fusion protein
MLCELATTEMCKGVPTLLVRGVRVLVVDDYPDNAESMGVLLRLYGHEVETALSGPSALESARAKRPEVVLLDIDMPGMSGYEVAAQLRGMYHGGVVLIAITAHGLEGDRRRCLEAGFDRHIVKPADPKNLVNLLRELANSL